MFTGLFGALVSFIPIFNGGIGLIFVEPTMLMVYLGNWAFVTLVIGFTFLLNSRPFLLEAIGVNNLGLLPF
jgi:uncharacterized membrane protein